MPCLSFPHLYSPSLSNRSIPISSRFGLSPLPSPPLWVSLSMSSMEQIRACQNSNGSLPASKEVLLEVQVNKLIDKFLFSNIALAEDCRNAGECGSVASKENTCRAKGYTAPPRNSQQRFDRGKPSDNNSRGPPDREICLKELGRDSWSRGGNEQCNKMCKEDGHGSSTLLKEEGSGSCVLSDELLGGGEEGKLARKVPEGHLARTETFPSKSKSPRTESSHPCDAQREVKHSCRKPPKPPRHPTLSSSSSSSSRGRLLRSASDPTLLLQAARRVSLERRRRTLTARSSSSATSVCALVFTVCFVVIMLAQGFWSQSSQRLVATAEAIGSSTSTSSVTTHMGRRNMLVSASAEELGVEERDAGLHHLHTHLQYQYHDADDLEVVTGAGGHPNSLSRKLK